MRQQRLMEQLGRQQRRRQGRQVQQRQQRHQQQEQLGLQQHQLQEQPGEQQHQLQGQQKPLQHQEQEVELQRLLKELLREEPRHQLEEQQLVVVAVQPYQAASESAEGHQMVVPAQRPLVVPVQHPLVVALGLQHLLEEASWHLLVVPWHLLVVSWHRQGREEDSVQPSGDGGAVGDGEA